MRVPDIRIGETYQVKVPGRLPPALRRLPKSAAELAAHMRLYMHCGHRFELTVTGLHPEAATVDGYESATTNRATVPLTPEQAERLDLPAGPTYEIDGFVTDTDGNDAAFTVTAAYTGLPARWLRPLAEPVPIDARGIRWYHQDRVRRQATGMTTAEVAQAADAAQERQRDLAGQALDSYTTEEWLRGAEVEHAEWRRISALMRQAGTGAYDPEHDPEATQT